MKKFQQELLNALIEVSFGIAKTPIVKLCLRFLRSARWLNWRKWGERKEGMKATLMQKHSVGTKRQKC